MEESEMREASMTKEEILIHDVLTTHLGACHAIKSKNIQAITGIPDRGIRDIIKTLVEREGIPIVSSVHKPYGFYIATTKEELSLYHSQLKSRLRSLGDHARAIEWILEKSFPQMELFKE